MKSGASLVEDVDVPVMTRSGEAARRPFSADEAASETGLVLEEVEEVVIGNQVQPESRCSLIDDAGTVLMHIGHETGGRVERLAVEATLKRRDGTRGQVCRLVDIPLDIRRGKRRPSFEGEAGD